MKLSQVLNAYCCDTALTQMTEKTAKTYLEQHDIVDSEVQRISTLKLKREEKEMKIRIMLLKASNNGMALVLNNMGNNFPAVPFEELYEKLKTEIEELL